MCKILYSRTSYIHKYICVIYISSIFDLAWSIMWTGIAQSVQRPGTGYTLRKQNRRAVLFFFYTSRPALETIQPPIQLVPGLGVNHPPPPPSSAEVKWKGLQYLPPPRPWSSLLPWRVLTLSDVVMLSAWQMALSVTPHLHTCVMHRGASRERDGLTFG